MIPAPTRPRLVLASASPRRRQLLREAGFTFDVAPADVDEDAAAAGLTPADVPQVLATLKARTVAGLRTDGAIVLAADTLAFVGTQILGKPRDRGDALRILRVMAGTRHAVATGVCLVHPGRGEERSFTVKSHVHMRPLTDADLEAYLDTGGWLGKAGAYGLQDDPRAADGDPFVTQIDGELTNIVGLPMPQVVDTLRAWGVVPAGHAMPGAAQ